MTPEQIKMLIESRIPTWVLWHTKEKIVDHMANIVSEAITDEREACAKIADGYKPLRVDPIGPLHGAGISFAAYNIANDIRRRTTPLPTDRK